MVASVLQEKLKQGLAAVSRAVSARPSLPVLANVLLEAREGKLRLSGTDLNLGVQLWVGAKVKKEGAISVPAKVFDELVSSLPPGTVEMEVEGGSLRVACLGNKVRLAGIAASEFPSLGKLAGRKEFSLTAEALVEAISRAAFASSSDETRPVLSGVLFSVEGGALQMVATDGYRLSLVRLPGASGKGSDGWKQVAATVIGKGLLIPARALRDVGWLAQELAASEVRVGLVADQNLVAFKMGDGEVTTRLIEGAFPDFAQILPKEEKTSVEIELAALEKAVRTASVFARDSANIVRWKLGKGSLTVSANAPSYGESESMVEVSLSGEGGEIAFNSRYLLELFSIFPSERMQFVMNGALDPGIFRPAGKGAEFLHLIMPVRVQK